MRNRHWWGALLAVTMAATVRPTSSIAQEDQDYLRDRGPGIPTSMFGTYVRKGELLVYPFYEYYRDKDYEYEPFDFGLTDQTEHRGKYRGHETLLFFAYGISDRLMVEFEAGAIDARFEKSPKDRSALPARMEKSGLNDVEGQIRWRWNQETVTKPSYFTYFETVFPTGKKHSLIGTSDWEFKLGSGIVKGLSWGTVTARLAIEYDGAENHFAPGEMAVEYLKRVSNSVRIFAMVEGTQDEWAAVPELQWFFSRYAYLKLGSGFAITSKATDFAPEVGIMFSTQPRWR
jgi:hypothetical protein